MGRRNRRRDDRHGLRNLNLPISEFRALCFTGKHRFNSEARAILAALKYAERHGKEQRVYRCDECQGWHLTTKRIEGR